MVSTWTDNTWLWFTSLTFTSVCLTWTRFCPLMHSQKVDSPSLHYSVYVPVWFIPCRCLILIQYLLHNLSLCIIWLFFSELVQSWELFLALFALYLFPPSNIHELPHTHTVKAIFLSKGFPVVIGSRHTGRRFKRDRIWLTTIGTVLSVTSSTLL